jgi:putative DNA primase/helicase
MSEPTPKPVVAPPAWENIPPELAQRQQWLLWKFEPPDKPGLKWRKVPYYVSSGRRTGDQGSDRDRHRLCVLEVARKAFDRGGWDGVGFGFLPGDGLIGIDIDNAIDDDGEVSPRCLGILASCPTFTEYSPSGKGCHVIGFGSTESAKSNDIGVEMFCGSQFFTVTGRLWPGSAAAIGEIAPMVVEGLHAVIRRAKEEAKALKAAVVREQDPRPAPGPRRSMRAGEDVFALVNAEAMRSFDAWVPQLIPAAKPYKGGYRATSKDLGRDLQEDLSIHPSGIQDFGVEQTYTPIDLVMAWLPAATPKEALAWLAARLGIDVEPAKPKPPRATQQAPAGGAIDAGGAGGDGAPPDDAGADHEQEEPPELMRHRGKPIDCRENVLYCLRGDRELQGLVRLNTFTELHERSRETPWGRAEGEWDEEDDLMLGEYLARRWQLLVKATSALRQGVLMAAREHKYNPIVDLIKSEKWDGTDRLAHWLTDVFEVEERPYTRLIGTCYIMGMVMRAMRPGCKFDYMLILKGEQGLEKSGAFRALATPWFTDNAIKVGDKDSMMAMQLVWIAESAELESLNKAETTAVKQFLSAQEDMYRPPYGAQIKKRPRHTVMGGTTNADTFLKDATGDRRFWPLEVMAVHLDRLRNMRLQLFAEALHRLRAKEQFWPSRTQEKELIFPEQERFKKEERWEDYLHAYVNSPTEPEVLPRIKRDFFPTTELYDKALNIKADRIDGAGQMDNRIANAMKALGFTKHRQTTGMRLRGWSRNPPEDHPEPGASPIVGAPQPTAAVDDDLPI